MIGGSMYIGGVIGGAWGETDSSDPNFGASEHALGCRLSNQPSAAASSAVWREVCATNSVSWWWALKPISRYAIFVRRPGGCGRPGSSAPGLRTNIVEPPPARASEEGEPAGESEGIRHDQYFRSPGIPTRTFSSPALLTFGSQNPNRRSHTLCMKILFVRAPATMAPLSGLY
jgi:hypothetical protein